jgi:hypothetical protein
MAKSKTIPKLEDLNGYFFMGIKGSNVDHACEDNTNNKSAIAAGFCSILETDDTLFELMSAALMIAIQSRENKKDNSKKSKKPVKTVKKLVNKK